MKKCILAAILTMAASLMILSPAQANDWVIKEVSIDTIACGNDHFSVSIEDTKCSFGLTIECLRKEELDEISKFFGVVMHDKLIGQSYSESEKNTSPTIRKLIKNGLNGRRIWGKTLKGECGSK